MYVLGLCSYLGGNFTSHTDTDPNIPGPSQPPTKKPFVKLYITVKKNLLSAQKPKNDNERKCKTIQRSFKN